MRIRNSPPLIALILVGTAGMLAAQDRTGPPMPPLDAPGALMDTPVSPIKGPIAGQLRYPAGVDPPKQVTVRLESLMGGVTAETWTDRAGRFEFRGIGCAVYVLAINATGYRPVRIKVEHSYETFEVGVINMIPVEGNAGEAASVPARESPIPEKAQKEFDKGRAAMAANKADEGIQHFRKAIQLYADYDEAYIELGMALLTRGSFPDAESVAKASLARNEKSALAHAILGAAYREQNKPQESLKELEASVKLEEGRGEPKSWFTHLELGRTLVKLNRTQESYPHFAQAHQLGPDVPNVHLNYYNALVLRQDYTAAVAELDEFVQLFPNHPQAAKARQQREALQATLVRRQP